MHTQSWTRQTDFIFKAHLIRQLTCIWNGNDMSVPFMTKIHTHISLGLWILCCLHLKIEIRLSSRVRQMCGIFHNHWSTTSIKKNEATTFLMQTMHRVVIFFGPLLSRIVCCLHLKIEFRLCARGVRYVASFITIYEQSEAAYIPHADHALEGFPFSQIKYILS